MAWTDKTLSLFTAQCNYAQNLLTTFNNIKYEPQMPPSCYQILVQDCTPELKFIVMLKNDNVEQKHINIKIADMWVWCQKSKHTVRPNAKKITKPFLLCSGSDIDLFPKSGNIGVKVNGVEIPMENLPYYHPTGVCTPLSTIIFLNWHELLVFVQFFGGLRELSLLCYVLLVKIQIRQKGEGISVVAPSLGLSEVYMDSKSWKV